MNRLISLLLCAVMSLLATPTLTSADKGSSLPDYEIAGAGVGTQGTYLVEVTVTDKKEVSDATLLRCAVHGVLFRGFAGKDGSQRQRPLAGKASAEAAHADYFDNFFRDGGPAAGYASQVSGSKRSIKSGKKRRTTATVSVNKDQLRTDLQDAGVLRSLDSAF